MGALHAFEPREAVENHTKSGIYDAFAVSAVIG
jgi:hypothetical protein